MAKKANEPDDRDLYAGLIRLHLLHHAVEGPFGLGMMAELARHGIPAQAGVSISPPGLPTQYRMAVKLDASG